MFRKININALTFNSLTVNSLIPSMNQLPKHFDSPIFESRSDAIEFVGSKRAEILAEVSEAGALLLRGLGKDNIHANQRMLEALSNDIVGYKGGGSADRETLSENITTVTPGPSLIQIPVHNELSYTENYPRFMAFFCSISAEQGGATSLASGRVIYESIDSEVREKLEKYGVCYKRFMYHSSPRMSVSVRKSWQETFHTECRRVVETELEKDGIEYSWSRTGLSIRQYRPAFIVHPESNQMVWFNQILNFVLFQPVARVISKAMFGFRDTGVEYGNGSPISSSIRRHIFDVFKAHVVNEPWQNDDILLVDNIACMHGRQRYRGKRIVTVGMFN